MSDCIQQQDSLQKASKLTPKIVVMLVLGMGVISHLLFSQFSIGFDSQSGQKSLPETFFFMKTVSSGQPFDAGDYVAFNPPESVTNFGWKKGDIFLKEVVAHAGDQVVVGAKCISVNGVCVQDAGPKLSAFLESNPDKEKTYTLKGNEYFVLGAHELSIDSRYFGPIQQEAIVAEGLPIL